MLDLTLFNVLNRDTVASARTGHADFGIGRYFNLKYRYILYIYMGGKEANSRSRSVSWGTPCTDVNFQAMLLLRKRIIECMLISRSVF